jgi:CPA1 family monovalent cation:H+ antiporter
MGEIEFLIVLLTAVALLVWVARQLSIPYPIVLVAGGLALGAFPGLPDLEIEPDVVFLVFVPPLVHAAGYTASPRLLARDWRPIGLAAVVLVGLTIAAVALVAKWIVPGMSWAAAFVLATVVAPTDLVAATAIFRRLGAPDRVVNLVEGENLVNDGTALTFWRLAVTAAVAGSLTLGDAVSELLLVAAGGTVVGLVGGYLVAELRRRLDDGLIEITVTILTAYLLYVIAEELHVSGILAAVVGGVYLGIRDPQITDAQTRLQAYGFWEVLTFVLESLLFILVGLQFPQVLDNLDQDAGELALAGVVLALVVMGVRLVYHFTVLSIDELFGGREPIGRRERLVVGWAGMRGAISLAVALSIPLTTDAGEPFPSREAIIFLTLIVIGVTLLVQGLTLAPLIRRMRFEEEEPDARRTAMVRFRTIEAALDHIGDLSFERDGVDAPTLERARSLYAQRANQLAGECRDGVPEVESDTAAWLRLRRDLLDIEKSRLVQMRDEGQITTPMLLAVQRDIDLEAARLERRMQAA